MKAKTKVICGLLFTASMAVGLGACAADKKSEIPELVNFQDKSIVAEVGTRYLPDMTTVEDKNGNTYNLVISAENAKGEEVGVTDGAFDLKEMSGYTVYYRAYFGSFVAEREVKIELEDTTAPELKFLNVRAERELGVIPMPTVYVNDNSGEKLIPTITVTYKGTPSTTTPVTMSESEIEFHEVGTYVLKAEANDSNGNKGTVEKEIVITESMGENVWENFSNVNHMETVKSTHWLTSSTEAEWLEQFNGEDGVAKIQPNYGRYYSYGFYVQLGLSKSYDEILACNWDYFTIRAYFTVKGANSVSVRTTDSFVLGTYATEEWVDITINANNYFSKDNSYMFPGFLGNETMDAYREAFAKGVTAPSPRPLFCASVGSLYNSIELSDVVIYIDGITWGQLPPDEIAPTILVNGAFREGQVLANSTLELPSVTITDNRDNITTYKERKFYKVTANTDEEIKINGNSVAIGDAGTYKMVVKAEDFSGNETEKEIFFTATDEINYDKFATFTYGKDGMSFGVETAGTASTMTESGVWLDSYAGENGVIKLNFNAGSDQNYLRIHDLNSDIMQKAVDGEFDYIRIRIYLDPMQNDTSGKTYQWRDHNAKYSGIITPNQWVDYDIRLDEMSNAWIMNGLADKSEANMRAKIQSTWASIHWNRLGYVDGGLTSAYTLYVSEISWGVDADVE